MPTGEHRGPRGGGVNMTVGVKVCMSDFLRGSSHLKHFRYQLAINKCSVLEVSKLRSPEL